MLCLNCGHDNPYGESRCQRCSREFAVFSPYVKANHVGQLQAAIRASLESQSLEPLDSPYARFSMLCGQLGDRWGVFQGRLGERLADPLRAAFGEGVAELDRAMASLNQALDCLDQALESGSLSPLGPADAHLTDFFKISCGACALILDELERTPEIPGLDVRSP